MNQHVRFRPEIGRAPVITRKYTEGASLADMVRDMGNRLPPEMWTHGVAQVGPDPNNIILPAHWHLVRPSAGTIVDFRPLPGDETLARIGIVTAQIFATLIPGIGPLVSAAIGIGGNLLLAELAPKPKSGAGGPAGKQLGQAGFASNQLQPYEQLQRVLGRKRVVPKHLAPPYVEVVGEDAIGVCVVGLAGRHKVSDILVNGTGVSAFVDDVTLGGPIIRTGLPGEGGLQIYNKVVFQDAGRRLSEWNLKQDATNDQRFQTLHQVAADDMKYDTPTHSKYRLGKILPDRIVIDFLWDTGIAMSQFDGKAGAAFQLCFAKRGAILAHPAGPASPAVYLPEVHFVGNFRGPVRAKIVIELKADPGGLTAPGSSKSWRVGFANSAAQNSVTLGSTAAHTYYGTGDIASHIGVTDPNILTIYVDPASITIDPTDELWIRKGPGYRGDRMDFTTNEYNFNGALVVPARWWSGIRVSSINRTWEDQAQVYSTCTIEYVSRIWDADALAPTGRTTVEMRLRNQQIDSISFVADGYVRYKWDRAQQQWTAEPHVSENPAEIAYDICRNPDPVLNSRPLSTSLLDDAKHGEWAEWCSDNGKRCNAVLESGSVEDALSLCYQAGHAKLVRSRKWAPWIEKPRRGETPIKIYGPRDFWNWTVEKSFARKPQALRVTFDNALNDWITEPERIIYAPGQNAANTILLEAANYPSIDTDYNVDARARLDLNIMRKRSGAYSFETRNRWLETPRGSLVGVNHPMLYPDHVSAGIRKVIYDDPEEKDFVMGLILDGEVEMISGTTGIAISTLDAEVIAVQSTDAGPTRQIMFRTKLANDIGIDEGAMVAIGRAGLEYIRCYVDDIKPGPRGSAKLILVDEAPEIHGTIGDIHLVEDIHAIDDIHAII